MNATICLFYIYIFHSILDTIKCKRFKWGELKYVYCVYRHLFLNVIIMWLIIIQFYSMFFYAKVYLSNIFMIYKKTNISAIQFWPCTAYFPENMAFQKAIINDNSIPHFTSSLIRSLPYANQITVIVFVHVKCLLSMILTTAFDWMLRVSGSRCVSGGAV